MRRFYFKEDVFNVWEDVPNLDGDLQNVEVEAFFFKIEVFYVLIDVPNVERDLKKVCF
ncbi:MAG: hypothetical protein LBB47_03905 [Spirochaetaceae bacterium]|jgi:hypothetical protein|nr:hypothetical protein [Spirochaetaceae bacterium]